MLGPVRILRRMLCMLRRALRMLHNIPLLRMVRRMLRMLCVLRTCHGAPHVAHVALHVAHVARGDAYCA